MKKILLVALAAAAMVGCSQNEEIENAGQKAEIKFNTVVKAGTKAAVTDINALEGTGFIVSAYNTGTTETGAVLPEAFIVGKEVSHSTGSWAIAGGTYYWPLNDFVQFFAYAKDGNAKNYVVASGKSYPTVDYTVAAVESQQDFVVAKLTGQKKSATAIALPFTHALTQVNFSVKAGNSALKYVVNKITISGLYNAGTYSFEDGTWANTGTTDASYDYTIGTGEAVTVTGTDAKNLAQTDGALMLMPQTMSGDAKITISYDVFDGNTQVDAVKNSEVSLTGKTSWEAGKNIRYTLDLTSEGASINLDPSVGPWADETSGI
mgnify:CR=1 FL=1